MVCFFHHRPCIHFIYRPRGVWVSVSWTAHCHLSAWSRLIDRLPHHGVPFWFNSPHSAFPWALYGFRIGVKTTSFLLSPLVTTHRTHVNLSSSLLRYVGFLELLSCIYIPANMKPVHNVIDPYLLTAPEYHTRVSESSPGCGEGY